MVIFDRILQKTFWAHFEVELSFHYSIAKINSIMNNKKYRHWFFNQCRYFRLCGSGLLSGISYSILTLTFFPENTIPNFKIS